MTPALVLHSSSSFYFVYFYHYRQNPQPQHLELLRMTLVCLPTVIIIFGALQAKREDVGMNGSTRLLYYDGQTESMLRRSTFDFGNLLAYDSQSHKLMDVRELPVLSRVGGNAWVPLRFENVPASTVQE